MKVTGNGFAGTLESSDAFVEVTPSETVVIQVESVVMHQFGKDIHNTVEQVLQQLGVTGASIQLKDRGALPCTIEARVETALKRAGLEG